MEFGFLLDEEVFCEEVCIFLKEQFFLEMVVKVCESWELIKVEMECWYVILNEKGWFVSIWLKEYGGVVWILVQCYIFEEEVCWVYVLCIVLFGLFMFGLVFMKFGIEC